MPPLSIPIGKNNFNNNKPLNDGTLKIYEEADHFTYLIYHTDCRALIGKVNQLSRFDDWEVICHNCKRVIPIERIKFVRIENNKK